ncbi:plant invertase/pectin methylesterase inhibitor superfamily [Actinidia rufa]|uniref:Pectinesterase n=1 Tax=Actinidia rufa TaxID=165716 RepID=A0A7J0DGM8_9ERIC|nr:plant invertase/pectin methylesterase inhibitor superfamily [Actinidia rufa]
MQSTITYNATVAQDRSGNYTSINDAIAAAPENSKSRYYIHAMMLPTTIITGNKSNAEGFKTYDTATMFVGGPGFIAVSLTIENSAPQPNSRQAVALNSIADRSAFYKCVFLGYQDTLYADHNRQFYKECDIYGSVDFIFGSAKAMFQDCNIYARRFPLRM